jgi:hypothetical protein
MPRIPGLTPLYRDVLRSLALCTRTDKDGKLVIDPTHAELARAAGCSEPTAYRVVAKAVEIGVIRKARHSDGRVSNSYELMLPNSAANGAKEPEKAPEKTQEFQRPTLSEMPASKPSNPITTGQGLKVESKEEDTDRPITVESSENSLNRGMDRPPEMLRDVTLRSDTPPCPVNTTGQDATGSLSTTQTDIAPCGAIEEFDQSKPTNTVSHGSSFNIGGVDEIDIGGAANPTLTSHIDHRSHNGPGDPDPRNRQSGGFGSEIPVGIDQRANRASTHDLRFRAPKVRITHDDRPTSWRAFYDRRGVESGEGVQAPGTITRDEDRAKQKLDPLTLDQDCGSEILKRTLAAKGPFPRNGQAARRSEKGISEPKSLFQPRNCVKPLNTTEEITTMPTKPSTARTSFPDPATIAADDAFFAALLEAYPRRDAADLARELLHEVLSEADNSGQLRVCLLDGVKRYEAEMRAADSRLFMSLFSFIKSAELWRPEYLEFNLAAAAA